MDDLTRQHRLDAAGLTISAICLVHCLALPIVAVLVPTAAFGFDHDTDHAFHWALLGLAAPISSFALWRGGVRSGTWRWLKLGSVGLALMLVGVLHVFGTGSEVTVTTIGVTLLAIAHVRNFLQNNHAAHAGHSYAIQERTGTMPPALVEDES